MTLGIFYIDHKSLIHVCDRTISAEDRVVCDKANKTLIVRAVDGIYSISYTGPALLHREGTDHWLAEVMIGKKMNPTWTHCPIPEFNRKSSSLIWKVSQSLKIALRRQSQYFDHPMKIVIAGYSWPKNRKGLVSPMVFELTKPKKSNSVSISGTSKEKSTGYRKGGFDLYFCPDGWLSNKEVDSLRGKVQMSRSVEDVESALYEAVVNKAKQTHMIGTDIMSVTIPYHSNQKISVKFDSLNRISPSYTPWVIGLKSAHLPFQFQTQSGWVMSVGCVDFSSRNPWRNNRKIKIGDVVLTPQFISGPVAGKAK